jgi:hypothetical protein
MISLAPIPALLLERLETPTLAATMFVSPPIRPGRRSLERPRGTPKRAMIGAAERHIIMPVALIEQVDLIVQVA